MKRTSWTTQEYAEALRNQGVVNHIEAACGQPIKRHKFNAVKTAVDGIVFDSKAEAQAYRTLKIAESAGAITELRLQPRYELQPKFTDAQGKKHRSIVYCGDFSFVRDGQRVCLDRKGFETAVFVMKAKMFRMKYPEILLEIWR